MQDIYEDIIGWLNYTIKKKEFILKGKELLYESKFWDEIPLNFQLTIISTISYIDTILYDLNLIKIAIENNFITEKEVTLLRNIGRRSIEFNNEYGRTYKEDLDYWSDYANHNFKIAEEIYAKGRDYFVTMQDATNAAYRLEDYMEKGHQTNNTINISGNVTSSQLQQGAANSTQKMIVESNFDYENALKVLNKINDSLIEEELQEDFGDKADEIKTLLEKSIEMVKNKEEPTKIINIFTIIKDLAIGVSGSLIASAIYGLITQLCN